MFDMKIDMPIDSCIHGLHGITHHIYFISTMAKVGNLEAYDAYL